jgi:hypothetical protein
MPANKVINEKDGLKKENLPFGTTLDSGTVSHSEELYTYVRLRLEQLQISLKDISLVVLGQGPGSYTGLRTSYAFAKGICFCLSIPLLSLPTSFALVEEGIRFMKDSGVSDTDLITLLPLGKEKFCISIVRVKNYELDAVVTKNLLYESSRIVLKEIEALYKDCFARNDCQGDVNTVGFSQRNCDRTKNKLTLLIPQSLENLIESELEQSQRFLSIGTIVKVDESKFAENLFAFTIRNFKSSSSKEDSFECSLKILNFNREVISTDDKQLLYRMTSVRGVSNLSTESPFYGLGVSAKKITER